MPALLFPTADALRLALASGLLPGAATGAPARAGRDPAGRLWVEVAELPPREALAALGRFGVVAVGAAGVATHPVRSWAELLPLRRSEPGGGPVLFALPDRQLAGFVGRLRRLRAEPVGVRLLPEPHTGTAWVTCDAPPAAVLLWAEEAESAVRAYRSQTPGVWVRRGWEHPLASHLNVPAGAVLLCALDAEPVAIPGPVPTPAEAELPLRRRAVAAHEPPAGPRVEVRFRLVRADSPEPEALWVLGADDEAGFADFCRGADERLLRRFEVASGGSRLLVRPTASEGPALPLAAPGYRPDPRLPTLFVPTGFALRPRVRASELARTLGLAADRLTWLEPAAAGGFTIHTVPAAAFRPLAERLEYLAPPAVALAAEHIPSEPFPLARFALRAEPVPEPEPLAVAPVEECPPEAAEGEPGWVAKSVGRLVRWVCGNAPADAERGPARRPAEPARPPEPASARVEQKLSSAHALLHGHDRAARRHDLETRLLADFPRLESAGRAARWAELAAVYGSTGQAHDASTCWLNAIWECAVPPPDWLDRWAEAERAAARPGDRAADLERWLAEPGRTGTGRVVAALAARAGFGSPVPPEFTSLLPRVLAVLDQHFEDVPARGAWLARLAVARACNGDALGLARWRDRLVARLRDRGPALDLDEPSFLRFRGPATAERFATARKWLTDMREPILAWVGRHAGASRLEWTGLEAEGEATAVYAQFILAWGLGALGERARARDWSARARKALGRAGGPRAHPDAHALLGDLFLHRIKDAHEGAAPKPSLPAELQARLDKLPEFARYAVDRLRERCVVLQPVGGVSAFHGRDLKEFWGHDLLGERLSLLVSRPSIAGVNDEARALLELAAKEPTTATVPRVALALLEVGAYLDPVACGTVVELVPAALDGLEAWVRAGRWTEAERPERVARYQARLIGGALAVAPSAEATAAVLRHLTGGAAAGPLLPAAGAVAGRAFRAARKFGLTAEAEALAAALDPGRGAAGAAVTADRVALAGGWFAGGDEDAGNRILDAAREYLYLAPPSDPNARTAVALAYAEALGFAPSGIALGRLEELFQRLGRVAVGGSTNCYFTLQPLRLVDAVVRSVVTDEFTLGPAVRAWLDADEFLIRRRVHRDMAAHLRDADGE